MAKPRAYERIEKDVKARIADGRYAVGQRLPTERDLAQGYGVSRPTVREAIRALVVQGILDVRRGAGVSVIARPPPSPRAEQTDARAFEVLEARILIEGEAAWLAASRISPGQLRELELLLDQEAAVQKGADSGLDGDRRLHLLIASASMNAALVSAVRTLWEARVAPAPPAADPSEAARMRAADHADIIAALRSRDPVAARRAMRGHLERARKSLMADIEAREVELARSRVVNAYARYELPPDLEGSAGVTRSPL